MTCHINNTAITIEPLTLYSSRLIDGKLYKYPVQLEDSIEDLLIKVHTISEMPDELYKEFARIARESSKEP